MAPHDVSWQTARASTGASPARARLGSYDYPTRYRVLEVVAAALFTASLTVFGLRLTRAALDTTPTSVAWRLAAALAAAALLADLLSGLVHFLCDTYGTPDTPLVGQKFIKSFRDHHDDPLAMTLGDAITVNADNLLVCLPVLLPAAAWLDVEAHLGKALFTAALVLLVAITNQAHLWAHRDDAPRAVRALQRAGLLLSEEGHAVHHGGAHDRSYCITTGMLNPLLDRLGLWRALSPRRGAPRRG